MPYGSKYGDVSRFIDNEVHRLDMATTFGFHANRDRVREVMRRAARGMAGAVVVRYSQVDDDVMWVRFAQRGQDPRFELPAEGRA